MKIDTIMRRNTF